MTDTSVAEPAGAHAVGGGASDHADDHHPADGYYVRIAVILAVITGVEVAWSYISGLPTVLRVGGLLAMMALKFFLVAAHFMHLRFDSKVLTRLFYTGLFLAVGVYLIALFTFRVFSNG